LLKRLKYGPKVARPVHSKADPELQSSEEKQLSMMSGVLNIRSPGLSVFKHRIQDGQELAQAGREGHFSGLACLTKTVLKGLDGRVYLVTNQSSL
jgi:hypothetical protein